MGCAVFFNLDGTLTEHEYDYAKIFEDSVREAGLEDLEEKNEEYSERFFSYFQKGWTFPRRQAILDVMRDEGMEDFGETDSFADAWEEREAEDTVLRDGAEEILEDLESEFSLGIVTNGTGGLQRKKLEVTGIRDYFDSLVISSEIGVIKPNADFFETAMESLEAEEYVIVSDDFRRDILPAKRSDFLTVWISEQDEGSPAVDARVDGLDAAGRAVRDICP